MQYCGRVCGGRADPLEKRVCFFIAQSRKINSSSPDRLKIRKPGRRRYGKLSALLSRVGKLRRLEVWANRRFGGPDYD